MQTFYQGQRCDAIAPNDRGFLYGDGLFTSVRVREGSLRLWPHHLDRLQQAQQRLGLQFDLAELTRQAFEYAEQLHHGTLKIIVSRGVGQRGYMPPDQPAAVYFQLFPSTIQVDEPQADGLFVANHIASGVLQTPRVGHVMPELAGLKTLNRLEQVLLRQALAQTTWSEGLVLDLDGMVIEGVQSNCWWRRDGQWQTPCLQRAGIAGVMRAEIMQRMQQRQIDFSQVRLHARDLDQVESLFFCNSLTGILAVGCFDGRPLQTKLVDRLLSDLLS